MAAAALVNAPSIDWTEDDGLHKRVEQFTRTVEDMMLGPLSTYKEPSKTRTLICWLPESIKELVREAGILKHNDYKKVTEFLLDWAKPKTNVYNDFRTLRDLNQGSMSFEQYAAKIKKLVNDCDIEDTEAKNLFIRNFIVTGANSQAAYRQCVEAGPNAKLERILEIYRNDAAMHAHFGSRNKGQPTVHQVTTELNFPKEEGEEDIHKLHDKRRYSHNARPSSPENRYKHNSGRTCHWCGNSHKPQECKAYGKQCLNCGTMNHFARVCNKRRSPRSSPNKSPISTRRPQSPQNNQFGHQNGSRINKLEPELDQMTVIRNLQEQLNQLQMRQQREVNAHSLKTTPISMQPTENTADHLPCPPPFFISRKEADMPQVQ